MTEVSGSDLDDDYDEEYDSSEVDINSEDAETESNIDDGLLDAVFDELPGTTTKIKCPDFFTRIYISGTGQTRPPPPPRAPTRPSPPRGPSSTFPQPGGGGFYYCIMGGQSLHLQISHSGYLDDILHVM